MNKHQNRKHRKKEPKEFEESVIQIDRVTRVVKGGRRLRFRATVCIGDQKGKVGLGIGKSTEVTGAIQKAIAKAKKSMIKIPLDGQTIPHDVKVKFKSSKILLIPASEGTGLIAGGSVRKVLELAGIKDILSKSLGSDNRVNNAKATVEALRELRETPRMDKQTKKEETKPAEKKAPAKKKEAAPKAEKPAKKAAPKKETKKEDKKD
jgi:small subunit ribosomal protein S5